MKVQVIYRTKEKCVLSDLHIPFNKNGQNDRNWKTIWTMSWKMKADNKVCNWSSKYKKYRNPIILHIKKQKREKEKKRKGVCLVIETFQKMNKIIE